MNEIKALEHPTLKVPYEVLNKKYRAAQKVLDLEARQVASAAAEIDSALNKETVPAGEIEKLLGGMVEKLSSMKRKSSEAISEEVQAVCVCKRRLDHLKEHAQALADPNTPQTTLNQWRKVRLDRMLVDYCLRNGYYDTADTLATATGVRDLTNVDIYRAAAEVEAELGRQQTGRCLQWCADNKSKLRKLNSNMEFKIRIQEFIELVRSERRLEAVKYAKRHLSNLEEGQLTEIQRCMGMLAFPTDTKVEPYKSLLATDRWRQVVSQFRWEHGRLLHPAPLPPLTLATYLGLAATNTPQCHEAGAAGGAGGGRAAGCPSCQPPLSALARQLPHAHCSRSRLLCRVTRAPLNEHNQPMVLPNGQVYGEQALKEMMKEHGAIICPKTKEVFCMKRVEKVYVM